MTRFNARLRALIVASLAGALLVCAAGPAHGHATTQTYGSTPKADGYGAFWIRIGHGCEDANGDPVAVNRVVVVLSAAWQSARPQQIAGWRSKRTELRRGSGYRVEWTAVGDDLRDDEFQDFGISVKYPSAAGTYRVPVVQHCGGYRTAWVEDGHDADHPAATITVAAGSGSSH